MGTMPTWDESEVGLGRRLGELPETVVIADGVGVADGLTRLTDAESPAGDGIVPEAQAALANRATAKTLGRRGTRDNSTLSCS
jgi:hypothetical protein